ncbi:Os07g0265850 [Oryza sativa Japonica Group]|uniref:Os07g0265850 protein n=1 Tax=Oryza sativa subsp. japonica TaxID=39947 RepID=A0A0P0X4N8_ORYSJ|nr:hypothetical protein DAI22_07g096300 [Oryza sativa Japonica Group]BAT00915.1 Os07g0265850 [Oryza sativa Japonica Group]
MGDALGLHGEQRVRQPAERAAWAAAGTEQPARAANKVMPAKRSWAAAARSSFASTCGGQRRNWRGRREAPLPLRVACGSQRRERRGRPPAWSKRRGQRRKWCRRRGVGRQRREAPLPLRVAVGGEIGRGDGRHGESGMQLRREWSGHAAAVAIVHDLNPAGTRRKSGWRCRGSWLASRSSLMLIAANTWPLSPAGGRQRMMGMEVAADSWERTGSLSKWELEERSETWSLSAAGRPVVCVRGVGECGAAATPRQD